MPDHNYIYNEEASRYERLIACQPDMAQYVAEIVDYRGLDIVDVGAGTGRLTVALAPLAGSIVALDAAEAMLQVTAGKLRELEQARGQGTGQMPARGQEVHEVHRSNEGQVVREVREVPQFCKWRVEVADNRSLPLPDGSADLIVAGWTVCYLVHDGVAQWEDNLAAIIAEMKRVLRPGGTAIIFETMGTGHETPAPPGFLQHYYTALVERYGCSHRWVRADYTFASVEEAAELTAFFFGDELAAKVKLGNTATVPECAGIWWLKL